MTSNLTHFPIICLIYCFLTFQILKSRKKNGSYKNGYRLFNIPKDLSGNDVGSLEHVLERRVKYFDDPEIKPDLLLIDGGKTQLKFGKRVLN